MPLFRPRMGRRADVQSSGGIQRMCRQVHTAWELLSELSEDRFDEMASNLQANKFNGQFASQCAETPELKILAFALVAESIQRTLGFRYYDCQLFGGFVLSSGAIAEMQTGEGKTITVALPAYLHALAGRGVHVITTNAYLAQRDHQQMRPVFNRLGLTCGLILPEMSADEKRHAYRCDITYGTSYDIGFDFLRDQLAMRNQRKMPLGRNYLARLRGIMPDDHRPLQRGHAMAIIDEVDSVLIDEANTPLILSEYRPTTSNDGAIHGRAEQLADSLDEERDFDLDPAHRSITFTEDGWLKIHQTVDVSSMTGLRRPWAVYVENALRAKFFLIRDIHYVIVEGVVQLVDQNTGRIHSERALRSGLHQAVESREGVPITTERTAAARISRQRYFQFYEKICGLTGTAMESQPEFAEFYKLSTVAIPTNRPCQRKAERTRFFSDCEAKSRAIVEAIRIRSRTGQPVLAGTRTIQYSRQLSTLLDRVGVPHQVLNGLQDMEEATIVSQAGQSGTVTIATNMAGRGTDIILDDVARNAGGLHVISTEHHPSRRIDRQLIGRAGRQGDPGSHQFFVAADDEIIQNDPDGLAIRIRNAPQSNRECDADFHKLIDRLQSRLELENYDRRRKLMQSDNWLETVLEAVAG